MSDDDLDLNNPQDRLSAGGSDSAEPASALRFTQLLADLGAECIKLDAKVDGLSERVAVESGAIAGIVGEIEELHKKYRLLYDAHMALQSKVYRLENQR